jgi:hypothetical protein
MSSSGILLQDITANSEDGKVTVQISSGTEIVDSAGEPVGEIGMELVTTTPPLPDNYYLMEAFDFGPDGTTFTPAIEITLEYDPSQIPEGQIPVIAYYDVAAGEWLFISGTIDAEAGTITFSIDHFTTFAVMGRALTHHADTAPAVWVWIVTGIVTALALVLIAWLAMRRRYATVKVRSDDR